MTHNGNTIAYLLLFDAASFFLHLSPHTISAKGKKKSKSAKATPVYNKNTELFRFGEDTMRHRVMQCRLLSIYTQACYISSCWVLVFLPHKKIWLLHQRVSHRQSTLPMSGKWILFLFLPSKYFLRYCICIGNTCSPSSPSLFSMNSEVFFLFQLFISTNFKNMSKINSWLQ